MSDSKDKDFVFVAKRSCKNTQGHWHVFSSKDDQASICGMENKEAHLNMRVGFRRLNLENEEVDTVVGVGRLCHNCREYLTGSLSDKDLPEPEFGSNRRGTGENILEKYERKAAEVNR